VLVEYPIRSFKNKVSKHEKIEKNTHQRCYDYFGDNILNAKVICKKINARSVQAHACKGGKNIPDSLKNPVFILAIEDPISSQNETYHRPGKGPASGGDNVPNFQYFRKKDGD